MTFLLTVDGLHTTKNTVVDAAFIAVVGVVLAAAIKAARCANRVVRLDGMDVDGRLVGLFGFLVANGRTIRLGAARDMYLKVLNGDCTVFFGIGPGGVQ